MDARTQNLITKYNACKKYFKLKTRYLSVFEYRNGLGDGKTHTQKETGQKFGISDTRVHQIEARVEYELEKL